MKKASDCKSLTEVRECIDALDKQIVELLGKRFEYVKEVVKFKDKDEDSIIAKPRYDNVIRTRGEWAKEHGLDPAVIEEMYRLLIDSFIKEEMKIIKKK